MTGGVDSTYLRTTVPVLGGELTVAQWGREERFRQEQGRLEEHAE